MPYVPLSALLAMAESPVFKVMACVDRGERRAPQVRNIGAEWDSLLIQGHRIYARCGSVFLRYFNDGGTDYYPGEFVQDHLWVENNTYQYIIDSYRAGRFYCTVANAISNPVWEILPKASYYRVRGLGKPQPRAYGQSGEFEPLFLLNPLFAP